MNERLPHDLIVRSLSFAYPTEDGTPGKPLFSGLDYSLVGGACGVILGGADAGKTTLSRICANLVPRFTGGALSGAVVFAGRNLLATKPWDAVDLLGLVFQDPDEQIFTTRCDTEIAFALESLGVSRADMEARIERGLELMGLEPFRHRNPATLSGGEKKRLMIACLAAIDPALWILDEVLEELDHRWKCRLIGHLDERRATALFFDSRWSSLYAQWAGTLAVLRDGALLPGAGAPGSSNREKLLGSEGLTLPAAGIAAPEGDVGESLLRIEGLSYRFPQPGSFALLVEGLDLLKGEVCALVGKNGSGKSTLAKVLCGLRAPASGTVSIRRGVSFAPAGAAELRATVGYLFQSPDYQVFLSSVFEELAFGMRAARVPEGCVRERVEEAIRLFRLPRASTPPALMSYGARKRLQAATYYLLGRALLILDEIDSGLAYNEFLPLLELLRASGAGIVLITHDYALARGVSARVIVMDEGKITHDLPRARFGSLDSLAPGEG
jgi:energy-coupling factor transport system ATP-binding protein